MAGVSNASLKRTQFTKHTKDGTGTDLIHCRDVTGVDEVKGKAWHDGVLPLYNEQHCFHKNDSNHKAKQRWNRD